MWTSVLQLDPSFKSWKLIRSTLTKNQSSPIAKTKLRVAVWMRSHLAWHNTLLSKAPSGRLCLHLPELIGFLHRLVTLTSIFIIVTQMVIHPGKATSMWKYTWDLKGRLLRAIVPVVDGIVYFLWFYFQGIRRDEVHWWQPQAQYSWCGFGLLIGLNIKNTTKCDCH